MESSLENFQKKINIVKLLKCNPFNWKLQDKNQMELKFLVIFEIKVLTVP